jgi:2'-5' RNA ligase
MEFYLNKVMRTPKEGTFRLFVALPVPAAVREELKRLQTELRQRLPDDCVRWTRPEQFHLTLRFLGEVDAGQVEALRAAVREVGDRFEPLHLRAEGVGFFPHGRPRVIWVGVQDDRGELQLLQAAVREAVGDFTREKEEKDFTGHLTIGRSRNMKSAQARVLTELAEELASRVFGEWTADQIEIVRSELSAEGSRYKCVAAVPLTGAKRKAE